MKVKIQKFGVSNLSNILRMSILNEKTSLATKLFHGIEKINTGCMRSFTNRENCTQAAPTQEDDSAEKKNLCLIFSVELYAEQAFERETKVHGIFGAKRLGRLPAIFNKPKV